MVPYRGHLVGTAVMSYISVAVLVSVQVVVSGNTECLKVVRTRPVAVVVCSKTKRKFERGYLLPSSMFVVVRSQRLKLPCLSTKRSC